MRVSEDVCLRQQVHSICYTAAVRWTARCPLPSALVVPTTHIQLSTSSHEVGAVGEIPSSGIAARGLHGGPSCFHLAAEGRGSSTKGVPQGANLEDTSVHSSLESGASTKGLNSQRGSAKKTAWYLDIPGRPCGLKVPGFGPKSYVTNTPLYTR